MDLQPEFDQNIGCCWTHLITKWSQHTISPYIFSFMSKIEYADVADAAAQTFPSQYRHLRLTAVLYNRAYG